MEVFGKSVVAVHSNVIYLSSILGQDGPNPVHKCDWKCENENLFGNMFRCKLTGLTHVCDKNCNQRIVYDNHSSLCRVSKQVFPLTLVEQQAVRGVRRKLDAEGSSTDSCSFKRRRDAQCHPSPFERPFTTVGPICSPIGNESLLQQLQLRDSSRNAITYSVEELSHECIFPAFGDHKTYWSELSSLRLSCPLIHAL
ncbi:hypothetical protein SASPL_106674 [Salvia splendens]|uniref:Uncharacterized protein n=1 Tax=Salvia splendens TaxID=180675 RepID=A0A8X8YNR3_SALSN|nr:hypothetical protein SASPL_106674 [Salvia splendens]